MVALAGIAEAAGTGGRALAVGDIVAAALRVGASKGFGGLTMRALAEDLGVSAMAAYHHVPSKDALLELVIDSVLAQVAIPPPGDGDWAARLRDLLARSRAVLRAWPGLEAVILTRPPTAQGRRLLDGYLRILLDGGFTPRNAAAALSVIHAHAVGRAVIERRLLEERARQPPQPDLPALQAVAGLWPDPGLADVRDFAEDVILDGLRAIRAGQQAGR